MLTLLRTTAITSAVLLVASVAGCASGTTGRDGPDRAMAPATTIGATTSTTEATVPAVAAPEPPGTAPATTPPSPPPAVPRIADDPAGLADQLVTAERAVRDPSTPPDVLRREAHTQQVAYRVLSTRSDWDAEVLGLVPGDLRPAVEANLGARREFLGMRSTLATDVPAWRIVEPPPADDLLAYYREAEAASGVGWEYLAAIHLVETGMGRIQGVSTAGAQGPMQFLPETWARWGEGGDITDPRDAILAASRYLADKGAPHDMAAAVFAYNRHQNYVRAVMAYAGILEADPAAYRGFYHWQIHYLSAVGDLLLPVGYEESAPIPAADYVATHPDRLAGPVPPGF